MPDDLRQLIREAIRKMTDKELVKELELSWDSLEKTFLIDEIKNRHPELYARHFNPETYYLDEGRLIEELKEAGKC